MGLVSSWTIVAANGLAWRQIGPLLVDSILAVRHRTESQFESVSKPLSSRSSKVHVQGSATKLHVHVALSKEM